MCGGGETLATADAGGLGRSPGHAGVRTVSNIRLQRPVRHLHQRRVRGQLRNTDGKVDGSETNIENGTDRKNQAHLVQDRFGRENVVQGLQRDVLSKATDQSSVNTASVRLCSPTQRTPLLLTLWPVWFMHLTAGVLRSSRKSGSFQWS